MKEKIIIHREIVCIPGECRHLQTKQTSPGVIKCYCKKLKRMLDSDEPIRYPEGCPYNETSV